MCSDARLVRMVLTQVLGSEKVSGDEMPPPPERIPTSDLCVEVVRHACQFCPEPRGPFGDAFGVRPGPGSGSNRARSPLGYPRSVAPLPSTTATHLLSRLAKG